MHVHRSDQARISDPKSSGFSKYESLSTDRLLALRESRHQDLLHGPWKGDDGLPALRLVTALAGLLESVNSTTARSDNENAESGADFPSQEVSEFDFGEIIWPPDLT